MHGTPLAAIVLFLSRLINRGARGPQSSGRMPQYDPLAATMESKEADDPAALVLLVLASLFGRGGTLGILVMGYE